MRCVKTTEWVILSKKPPFFAQMFHAIEIMSIGTRRGFHRRSGAQLAVGMNASGRFLILPRHLNEAREDSRGGAKDVVFLEALFAKKSFERGIDYEALSPTPR